MLKNIVICGIGGQGNILASGLLGSALVDNGYQVSVGETYGASQRGGSVMSHLRVSDDMELGVLIPHGQADIVLGFEPVEALRLLREYGNAQTVTIYDPRPAYPLGVLIGEDEYPEAAALEAEIRSRCAAAYIIPATDIAMQAGNAKAANIVLLGALLELGLLPLTAAQLDRSLTENFSGAALELNRRVLKLGAEELRRQLEGGER